MDLSYSWSLPTNSEGVRTVAGASPGQPCVSGGEVSLLEAHCWFEFT